MVQLWSSAPFWRGAYCGNSQRFDAGVGAQYKLSKQVALPLEYERYSKKTEFGAKPEAITVGTRFKF
jgi:opacity protein-like surface antigen